MREEIIRLWEKQEYDEEDRRVFDRFLQGLTTGNWRAAQPDNGDWHTVDWVRQGLLVGFRMGNIRKYDAGGGRWFTDKDTYPERFFTLEDRVRLVPGGSSVRMGAYVGRSVTLMPPMYINVGAYVDDGSMIDSHALVGSCAQVGKNVHLSAGAILGGVLEPIGATPVIVEDNVFIGGNAGIFEGVLVRREAVIAAGVILTGGTPVFDAVHDSYLPKTDRGIEIPPKAVIVPGTRKMKNHPEISLYCPVIVKYRDSRTDASVTLQELLR